MKSKPMTFAATACIVAAAFVSGCQQHKKQARKPGPPPIDRSSTTLYNSGELPPKANRTRTRAFPGAKIIQTGMDVGPALPPAQPPATEMLER